MDKKILHKTFNENRTEEVVHIIEKMPTRFGTTVSGIVISLVILLLVFGWLIKYPEVLRGQIIINTRQAPVKLVAATSGTIILLHDKTGSSVKTGEYLAFIKNAANIQDVQLLDRLLHHMNIHKVTYEKHRDYFPENLSLGDLNNKYFNFLNALYQSFVPM